MFTGNSWKKFVETHPDKAATLKKYISEGGSWGTIMFLPEYHEYMRFEEKKYTFKSNIRFFEEERIGLKPNTVRKIDLNDQRFQALIFHYYRNFIPGEIEIIIESSENPSRNFARKLKHIAIWDDLMILSWEHPEPDEVTQ